MTTNHPAHGPVSLNRLHQIREILSKATAQSDGGNLGYAMADAVKVIDGAIAAFGAEPVTLIKPVSDLYSITSPTGSETTFTFDAGEASSFAKGGWTVQEYVELERYQQAMAGNSPVTPDCSCRTCRPVTFTDSRFVVCHECGNKRCPHANDHRNACTGSNEPGQEGSAYSAEPQQEVKSALEHGMQRYAGAMQKLSEGDK
ncbi:hypothetical protein Q5738_09070 [Citrobacter werkmanii]|uniref:hypothetical protein n=1 Tax=Citrobacter werkmanii TaxID=67827 RepID=UPI00272512D2|nr:hypothetical protein [Citrobacter werkmanii]MDO8233723.1 hypothetical protein [Citrobacter werkmanii]